MEILNIAANVVSILSFLISCFVAYKIVSIEQTISQTGGHNKAIEQTIKGDHNIQNGRQ